MKINLGTNYLALAVKDIFASKEFYESIGFEQIPNGGDINQKWLIMSNDNIKIGLFQDMFPSNIITFNPPDARLIYKHLAAKGISFQNISKNIEEKGPCNFMIADPDGNQLLFDQHND